MSKAVSAFQKHLISCPNKPDFTSLYLLVHIKWPNTYFALLHTSSQISSNWRNSPDFLISFQGNKTVGDCALK